VLDDLSNALAGFIAAQATPVPLVDLPKDGRPADE
jgi:DUF917 family protein